MPSLVGELLRHCIGARRTFLHLATECCGVPDGAVRGTPPRRLVSFGQRSTAGGLQLSSEMFLDKSLTEAA